LESQPQSSNSDLDCRMGVTGGLEQILSAMRDVLGRQVDELAVRPHGHPGSCRRGCAPP